MSDNLLSNNPQQVPNVAAVQPDGLAYTALLATDPKCLYVYVENPKNRFNFNLTKGTGVPKAFNSISAMFQFMSSHPGTLVIYQDGSADWNFSPSQNVGSTAPYTL